MNKYLLNIDRHLATSHTVEDGKTLHVFSRKGLQQFLIDCVKALEHGESIDIENW